MQQRIWKTSVLLLWLAVLIGLLVWLQQNTGFLAKDKIDMLDHRYFTFDDEGYIVNARSITLKGNNQCWVMAHGYTSTPDALRNIAEALHNTYNDTIYVPLYKGHGRKTSEIEKYTVNEWYEQIAHVINQHNCTNLLGISMGASIMLKYAEEHKVDKLVLVSLPIIIQPEALPMRPLLWLFWKLGRYTKKASPGKTINDPEGNASHIASPNFPLKGAVELNVFNDEVLISLNKVRAKVLIIHAKNDTVMSMKGAQQVYEGLFTTKQFFIVPEGDHIVFRDYGKEAAIQAILKFRAE